MLALFRYGLISLLLPFLLMACDDSKKDGDKDHDSWACADCDADGMLGDDTVDPWAVPSPSNDWEAHFYYKARDPQDPEGNQIMRVDAQGQNVENLNDYLGLGIGDPALSCDLGCVFSDDMKWLGFWDFDAETGESNLIVGPIKEDGAFNYAVAVTLKGVSGIAFSEDRLYYSKRAAGTGEDGGRFFQISVLKLGDRLEIQENLFEFPPASLRDRSSFQGRFRVSEDGRRLVLLSPTNFSVSVYTWSEAGGLEQLDQVCKIGSGEECSGGGSDYADDDTVGISKDGRYVAFFSYADRFYNLYLYDTADGNRLYRTEINQVQAGSYIDQSCHEAVQKDWSWQKTLGPALFTVDGEELVFMGENACDRDSGAQQKPQVNFFRIKLERLFEGGILGPEDVFRITQYPAGNVTANKRPESFALSPDGGSLVFVGTPSVDSQGRPIADGEARQRNDREVYRINLDGSGELQLSNDVSYAASAVTVRQKP